MKRDNPNLDLLRSVAVLLVLFAHLINFLGYRDAPLSIALGIRELAQLAVLMFFIHTSLVLMMSLERLQGAHVVPRFYIRRAFRIYPLAILAVVVVVALRSLEHNVPAHLWMAPDYTRPTASTIWQNLLLVQNLFHAPDILGPMWSLPLEVQMYLVLPLIFIGASRIKSYTGAIGLIAVGFSCFYLDSHIARYFGRPPFAQYSPWFFMGCAAYGLYRVVTPRVSPRLYAVCLLLFAATPYFEARFLKGDYRAGWVSWLSGVIFALALPHFKEIRSLAVRKCAHRIARYSYGIYLAHVPIMSFVFRWSAPRWLQFCVLSILLVTIPVALFHAVEDPMIKMGARFADLMNKPKVGPVEASTDEPSLPVSAVALHPDSGAST